MLKFNFDQNGLIKEIGYQSNYNHVAPSWMTMASDLNIRCTDIPNYQLETSWVKLPIANISLVNRQRMFCNNFQSELLAALRDEDLTNAQRVTLLTTIKDAMNVLSWGDAEVARVAFASINTTALWTQPRKDWVLGKIDAYLNG